MCVLLAACGSESAVALRAVHAANVGADSARSRLSVFFHGRRPEHLPFLRVRVESAEGARELGPGWARADSALLLPEGEDVAVTVRLVSDGADTLVATPPLPLRVAPRYLYGVSVRVSPVRPERQLCSQPGMSYPLRGTGRYVESLFVHIGGLPIGAIC
jgi:hypothetical protein